jgi:hypothetical protein
MFCLDFPKLVWFSNYIMFGYPSVDNLVPEELDLVSVKGFGSWSSTWQSLVSDLVPTRKSSSWFSIWQKSPIS